MPVTDYGTDLRLGRRVAALLCLSGLAWRLPSTPLTTCPLAPQSLLHMEAVNWTTGPALLEAAGVVFVMHPSCFELGLEEAAYSRNGVGGGGDGGQVGARVTRWQREGVTAGEATAALAYWTGGVWEEQREGGAEVLTNGWRAGTRRACHKLRMVLWMIRWWATV